MDNDPLSNPIEDAFDSIEGAHPNIAKELFSATSNDIDFKTDVICPEDIFISSLRFADSELEKCSIGAVFAPFIDNLLNIRISLDRKSRQEFVSVNSHNLSNIQLPGDFSKIEESRK